jgi:hypothetical protein
MDNAKSYDPRMDTMPVLISYPRSGSNYFNCLAELYFDRPRLRGAIISLLEAPGRTDFMWFHDHDRFSKLKLTHENIAYLYREPEDVIYSLLASEHPEITIDLVNEEIKWLGLHYDKYLLSDMPKIKYERFADDLPGEFAKFAQFLLNTDDVNIERLRDLNQKVTKQAIIKKAQDKRYFNDNMLTKAYNLKKDEFKVKYKKHIRDSLITPSLQTYFNDQ